MKYKKIYDSLYFTGSQVILIVLLVVAFEIFFSLWMLRTEDTSDPNVFISYLGFPFGGIKIKNVVHAGSFPDVGEIVSVRQYYEYLWGGIIMNLISYIVFSVIIIRLTTWIRDEIEYHRYYKSRAR